jgi:hypothetical protein
LLWMLHQFARAGVQCPRRTIVMSTSAQITMGVSSLNLTLSPNLQIKSRPRIMSGDVGESELELERNTRCSIFLFIVNWVNWKGSVTLHLAWKELPHPVKGHSSLVGKAWSWIHLGILESFAWYLLLPESTKAHRRVSHFAWGSLGIASTILGC